MIPRILVPAIFAMSSGALWAQEMAPAPDTSAWVCRFCTVDDGWTAWVEPGLAITTDDSYHFGDVSGLNEQGTEPELDGAWRWRDAGRGQAFDARVERLGRDSQAVSISGGRQGAWQAWLDYDELPHYVAADGRTPFSGGANLQLPAGWVTAGSTGGMSQLDASLRGVSLDQVRERSALGLRFRPQAMTDGRIEYRREVVRGTGLTGATFLTLSSQLPRPVDQVNDRIDAALGLHHPLVNAQVALESSFFRNEARALTWQNPYNPLTPGATGGRMGQSPDSSAHRLTLSAGTAPGTPVQASAQLSLGRLRQDDGFLPATTNPGEAVALPRSSLDGRVDTTLATVKASYAASRSLRLNADVLRDDRENHTPVDAFTQVVTDTFAGDVRTNAPFGFTRNRWRFSADWRSAPRVSVGVEDDRRERRQYGTAGTVERRYWGRASFRPLAGSELKFRATHAHREGEEFSGSGAPAQNPLLRAFNTAERDRDEARADFSLAGAVLTHSLHVSYARNDYPGATLGRSRDDEVGYGGEVAAQATENLSISAFVSYRSQETDQAGSQAFGQPDWRAGQEDATRVLGASFAWDGPRGLELGADYVLSASEGTITMLAAASESEFPVLTTRWDDARVHAAYPLRPGLSLKLELMHERYRAGDWGQLGLAPDTASNLLALGQGTQGGSATAVLLGVRYEFAGAAPGTD